VTGNPTLRPERGDNRDLGVSWSIASAAREAWFEWAYFDSHATDLILYWSNSPNTTRADNVSSARIRGEELSVRLRPFAALAVSGSATWQSAIDTGPVSAWRGRRLPQRPGRQAYGRVDLTRAALRAAADLQYLGDDYRDRYNTPRERVASRTLVGASLSAALRGAARVVVEGKNLGDRRVSDVAGYPLPGRSVFVSLEVRLGSAGSAPH
jgi:iron complex outermembrane receptor protein